MWISLPRSAWRRATPGRGGHTGGGFARLRAVEARKPLDGGGDGLAGVLGREDDGVPGLLEDLPDEPVGPLERELDDGGAVGEVLEHRPLLTRPAGTLGGDPHPR